MTGPELLGSDLEEAAGHRPAALPAEQRAFALRQLRARRRLTLLLAFYRRCPSRMARIHLLTAAAVCLGRFCGYSATFDAMGEALMPVDGEGRPLTEPWAGYAKACADGRPRELRDELWIAAHVEDMERVRREGTDRAFYAEADAHPRDATWLLLRQHMQMTVDARLIDHAALAGAVPYETAIAQGMRLALFRIFTAGGRLLGRYAWVTARALLLPSRETKYGLVTDRRAALTLLATSVTAWSAAGVYRRGVRGARHGARAEAGDAWPLLAEVLGDRVAEVHPLIVRFYSNPAAFDARVKLELRTLPARFWSFVATLLVGQGLYETQDTPFDARFRVFRREDGSMHFVRELYCRDALRVFDSDFVVRRVEERPTLFEVFVDHGLIVEMDVAPLTEGGLSIRSRRVTLRRWPLPSFGLRVEFRSRVVAEATGYDALTIEGDLRMEPRTRLGRLLAHGLLRRPRDLGRIRYDVRLRALHPEPPFGVAMSRS
jgi:hypothetical protein